MAFKKIDANQNVIVKSLRQLGVSVAVTSSLGKGFPDIVVGWESKNYLFELKDGLKVESQKRLTPDEQAFFDSWKGQVNKCECLDDILKIIL